MNKKTGNLLKRMLAAVLMVAMILTMIPLEFGMREQTEAAITEIPNDAVLYEGHYYKVFEIDTSWSQAKEECEKLGGHMVVITSFEEDRFIISLLTNAKFKAYWLGGFKDNENNWRWITNEIMNYTGFMSGQPDSGSDCVLQMLWNNGWGWDDTWNEGDKGGGEKIQGYICEWEEKISINVTTISMVDEYTASVDEPLIISAEIASDSFVPKDDTVSWEVKGTNGGHASITDKTVVNSLGKTHTVSAKFTFSTGGEYTVTLKTADGASKSVKVYVYDLTIANFKQNKFYSHKFSVRWDTVSAADGYFVQYSANNEELTEYTTKYDVSGNEYESISLTRGNTYNVRVRAYKRIDSTKVCGKWSETIQIKLSTEDLSSIAEKLSQNQYIIKVVDRRGNAIRGAKVKWSWNPDDVKTTEENGIAIMSRDYIEAGQPVITVSCSGYHDYSNESIKYSVSKERYEVIVLHSDSESPLLLKSAIFVSGDKVEDLLYGVQELSTNSTSQSFSIICKTIDSSNVDSYSLYNKGKLIASCTDGKFDGLKVTQFEAGERSYVRVKGKNGLTADTEINLSIKKEVLVKAESLKIGSSSEIAVSNDIPYLGSSKLKFDFPGIPVEFFIDDDDGVTIHLGINTAVLDGKTNKELRNESWKNLKETVSKLKTLKSISFKSGFGENLKSMMKEDVESNLGPGKVSWNFIGYGEGKLNKDGLAKIKAYLCITLSYSRTLQGPTTIVVCVPVTYSVKYGLEGKLSVDAEIDLSTMVFESNLECAIKPNLQAFGGLGVGKLTGVGVYGSGELPITFRLMGTSGKGGLKSVNLKGDLGLKVYAGPLEYKKAFAYNTWYLYTQGYQRNTASVSSDSSNDPYESGQYNLSDLSYLSEESSWLGETHGVNVKEPADGVKSSLTPLMKNTYHDMQPVIGVTGDGTPVMVWAKGTTDRGDYDTAQLVYSVYGANGWSSPKPVDPTNVTCDAAPSLCTDTSGKLYLAYRSSSRVLPAGSTISDYASVQSIVVAEYDADSESFKNFSVVSESGKYNYLPAITTDGSTPVAAWMANADTSDFFAQNNTNCIMYSRYQNGRWSTPVQITGNMGPVISLSAGKQKGTLSVAAVADDDLDLGTVDDRSLVLYSLSGGGKTAIDKGTINWTDFQVLPGQSQSSLIWNNEDTLYSQEATKTMQFSQNGVANGVRVLSDRVLMNSATESASELFAVEWIDGWQEAVQLTEQDNYLQSFDAVEAQDNTYITAVQTDVTITDAEVSDECTLSWMILSDYVDLSVADAVHDDMTASLGEEFKVDVLVHNEGTKTVSNYRVAVINSNGYIVTTHFNTSIAPGEEIPVTVTAPALKQVEGGQMYSVSVTASNANDVNRENDHIEFVVGNTDLDLSVKTLRYMNKTRALITVANKSKIPAGGMISVSAEGTELAQILVDTLDADEQNLYEYEVTAETLEKMQSEVLEFNLTADVDEWNNSNNYAWVSVDEKNGAELITEVEVPTASGYTGDLTWSLIGKKLLIKGTGNMRTYDSAAAVPWSQYKNQITSVVVESGAAKISPYAFYGMDQLTSVTLPDTVKIIGEYAFRGCTSLTEITLPKSLTKLSEGALYGCSSLTSITIPEGIYTVWQYCFKNCTSLTSVSLPKSLIKLGEAAFYGCSALTSIQIPDNCSIIDVYCFKNCSKLASVKLPATLGQLREAVFYATAIPSLNVPSKVTSVGPYAFKRCTSLASISLPASLTKIDEAAFYECEKFSTINIPDAVTTIGNYAFRRCTGLTSVNYPASLKTVGECSFYGCTGLTEITLPEGLTEIKDYAYKACSKLTRVNLPETVEILGESAFNTCQVLASIRIPASVKTIKDYCFSGDVKLKNISFEGNAPAIGVGAYKNVVANVNYPKDNSTWTSSVKQNYGGNLTWTASGGTEEGTKLSNPRIVADSSMKAGQKTTWDCVWFGSYPQREVVAEASQCGTYGKDYHCSDDYILDSSLYSKLQNATYDSNGNTTINGIKYKRLSYNDATYYSSTGTGGYAYYNWYKTYHYFRYEPIKWRVLSTNGSQAYLLADQVLDDRKYNETRTDVSWENCTLRAWLNDSFYKNAFSQTERGAVITTDLVNKGNNYIYDGDNDTQDKVFLLAESDACVEYGGNVAAWSEVSHGFVSNRNAYDEARRAKTSTYGKAIGTYSSYDSIYSGNCSWWLRSHGDTEKAMYVSYFGYAYEYGSNVDSDSNGVRPALNLDLSSLDQWSYAGTVCSDGTVDEP